MKLFFFQFHILISSIFETQCGPKLFFSFHLSRSDRQHLEIFLFLFGAMELLRRIASGWLSEVFGSNWVKIDEFFAGLGVNENSIKVIAEMDKKTKLDARNKFPASKISSRKRFFSLEERFICSKVTYCTKSRQKATKTFFVY